MKKSILTLLLSFTLLLTACELPSPSGQSSDLSSGTTSSSIGSNDSSLDESSSKKDSHSSENGNSSSEGNKKPDSSSEGSFDDSSDDSSVDFTEDEEHTDKDQDDICDDCKQSVAVTFDVFAINDLHGKLDDGDNHPGVDELSTYLKNAKATNPNTILLSSGDMWQGASESNLTKGNIITEWMNEMDFVSMTLGNHEYDWGEQAIINNAELAEFPFLAINVYSEYTNQQVDYCQSSVMVEQSGVKIGIIGAMGDCYSSISSDKVEDVYFKTGSALTALVKDEAISLREQGADCIIYSIHDGYADDNPISNYYDVSLSEYVDIVFEGHSHQQYIKMDYNGVYHLQGGGDNKGVSHAALKINIANDAVKVEKKEFISTSVYKNLEDDPIVDSLLEKYEEKISIADKLLGTTTTTRYSNEICDTVAQVYYQTGVEKWGDEYEIVAGGGFLQTRAPYNVYSGNVYYGDLMNVLPFDNPIVLCSIRGYYLRTRFLASRDNYHTYSTINVDDIDDNETYYVITDRYSSLYEWNRLRETEVYDEETFARDLLAKYIQAGGWGNPAPSTPVEPSEPSTPSNPSVTLTDIPTLLSICGGLEDNTATQEKYYVQGTIVMIHSEKYGNITIQDADGNQLYIYNVREANGTTYSEMENKPQVGVTVTLYGALMKYVTSTSTMLEMYYGVLQ